MTNEIKHIESKQVELPIETKMDSFISPRDDNYSVLNSIKAKLKEIDMDKIIALTHNNNKKWENEHQILKVPMKPKSPE